MSAPSSQSQKISPAPPAIATEHEASCRVPVLLLFLSATVWLVAASVLGLMASLTFHSPTLLAGCPWMTYGRLHPAAFNAFTYGFAIQAGLGVLLWIICQAGGARLALTPLVVAGWLLWNLGVKAGFLGILYGENTGFEWLEMPRYAAAMLFSGFLAIGLPALLTFHRRATRQIHVALWFVLAAFLWFPWIYSSANFLLLFRPVRGVMQSVVAWWFINNLGNVWFPLTALAAAFWIVPRLADRPLHSRSLGLFVFWMLVGFGSWGGVPTGAPVPPWLPALSTFAAMLGVVTVLGANINVLKTLCGRGCGTSASARFIAFGLMAYVAAGLMNAISSRAGISVTTHFTWWEPAQTGVLLYGFFALTIFGAMYYILPRLAQSDSLCPHLAGAQFWFCAAGIVLYALPLAVGGILQGLAWRDPSRVPVDALNASLGCLRASSTGELLMIVGNFLLLANLLRLLFGLVKAFCLAFKAANFKPAEAAT